MQIELLPEGRLGVPPFLSGWKDTLSSASSYPVDYVLGKQTCYGQNPNIHWMIPRLQETITPKFDKLRHSFAPLEPADPRVTYKRIQL